MSRYGVEGGINIWNVYRFVFDTLRQKGAIIFPEVVSPEDDFFSPRNHAGFFRSTGNEKLYRKKPMFMALCQVKGIKLNVLQCF